MISFNNNFYLKNEIEKIEKIVSNLHDKEEYVIHIRNLNA